MNNQDAEYIEQEESDEWDPAIGMRDGESDPTLIQGDV